MELNNFNEYIVETGDPITRHDCCCIQTRLSLPTAIIGLLGSIKLIVSLICRNMLGKVIYKINPPKKCDKYPSTPFKRI